MTSQNLSQEQKTPEMRGATTFWKNAIIADRLSFFHEYFINGEQP